MEIIQTTLQVKATVTWLGDWEQTQYQFTVRSVPSFTYPKSILFDVYVSSIVNKTSYCVHMSFFSCPV